MNQKVVYTLNPNGNLGCFPEGFVIDTDENGVFLSNCVKINKTNKSNFAALLDDTDEKLLNCCFQLEKETIVLKILQRNIHTWDDLLKKYFNGRETKGSDAAQVEYIKKYVTDYINSYTDSFFEHLGNKALYLPNGKFPFSWQQLRVELEIPDMFYCFDYDRDGLSYSIRLTSNNKTLNIKGGVLVSRNRARLLLKNSVYEFESYVDGTKLTPFFAKDAIKVPKISIEEYIKKVILPLVSTNRIIASGFEIVGLTEISNVVLRVKEVGVVQQTSLFGNETPQAGTQDIVFELIFRYDDFTFWAGQSGALSRFDLNNDLFIIYQVQRDEQAENQYIDELKKIGIDLNAKVKRLPYYEGVEWLNDNYKLIESAGIEIEYKKTISESRQFFMGDREINVELKQHNDWFDIHGKVRFGDYEVPFLLILTYIKHNKRAVLLPNGEYAQIPQAWFDEYYSLAELCVIENGKAKFAKHYIVLADKLAKNSRINLAMKDKMRHFLSGNTLNTYNLPQGFQGELRQYQQQGYNWLRLLDDLALGGCLADDMGLGKTIQTLCLLQYQKENNRGTNLLVVPTSLVYNWQQEAAKFTPALKLHVHVGNQRSKVKEEIGQPDVLLTSYAILRRDRKLFEQWNFNYIILDEAQAIKNPQSDISQVCLSLKADRHLTLTGTPIENSLSDLWSQVHFFNRNMLGSLNHFNKACKLPDKIELYKQLIKPFLLRRHKTEVLTDLPEKTIIVQNCEMSDEQKKFYRNIRNSYRDKFLENKDKNYKVNPVILLEGLLRLRQAANHPQLTDKEFQDSSGKFDVVCQMLNSVTAQGDKVLVFSSFVEHLKLYRSYLDEQNTKYCYLDGATQNRQEQVARFQDDDDYRVFLLSLKAGGTGLNLTRASYVFLLDPWWNPAAEAQAYDRAHRIGQTKSVFVYKFITTGSIEEKILKLQEQKLLLSDKMLENEENSIIEQLDVEAVMKLIE